MEILTDYAYLWGTLFAFFIVLVVIYNKPNFRREMIFSGILVGLLGVVSEYWFFRDYWHPMLIIRFGSFGGLEDFLFGFTAGAMGSIIYTWIYEQKLYDTLPKKRWVYPLFAILGVGTFMFFTDLLKINSIFASMLQLLVFLVPILYVRRDLWKNSLVSAVCFGFALVLAEGAMLIFLKSYLPKYYLLNDSAPVILGIFPVTEFFWGASFGAIIGPLYEFAEGKTYKRNIKKK